jgi:hypothetical protein
MEEDIEESAIDACLIAAGQRAEHYEIAAYGSLVAWARAMGHTEATDLLESILEEEKAADEKLTFLAEGGINEQAARSAHGEEELSEDDEADEKPAGNSRSNGSSGSRTKSGKKTSVKR